MGEPQVPDHESHLRPGLGAAEDEDVPRGCQRRERWNRGIVRVRFGVEQASVQVREDDQLVPVVVEIVDHRDAEMFATASSPSH
jgi:hypothetical protein